MESVMYWFFFWINVFFILLTLLPAWRYEAWWVRGMDFPRLQLAILLALLLAVQLLVLDLSLVKSWVLISVSATCLAYQLWWVVPYTRLFPVEVKAAKDRDPQRTIRVMTANVCTPNRHVEKLVQLVRNNMPDVLVTLESDQWWQDRLAVLEDDYPYSIKCPLDNLYGMHVYSKLKLSQSQVEYLVEPTIPSMHTLIELPSRHQIRVHFLHPAPPSPTENEESTERDAELVMVARSVAESDEPIIVTGDLNDVAWSATTRLFRKLSGLLDPRVGRGMFNTFHAGYWPMRWPLDHLFHSEHFTLLGMRRLPAFGSDHFAILTELCYEPEREVEQEGLNATPADQQWAEDKMQSQNVTEAQVPEPRNNGQ
jgi:endonuclease/exonuclease/phosphatase (EEP) superfamily protein YafD